MKINPVRLVDEFMRLVEIDSPTYRERPLAGYVSERMRALKMFVLEDGAGEKIGGDSGNIYGLMRGDDSIPPLMFCAHLDTVEPSRGKRAVLAPNGRISSAGDTVLGADDLAGVAVILEALTVLHESGARHGPIEVLFTVAEEVYCKGSRVFDFSKVLSEEAYVLDLAGPVGTAAYAAPSIVTFTVTIRGRAAAKGRPRHRRRGGRHLAPQARVCRRGDDRQHRPHRGREGDEHRARRVRRARRSAQPAARQGDEEGAVCDKRI
jgi:tripeptide aminopeptidase